jgi:HEAT repeat protein
VFDLGSWVVTLLAESIRKRLPGLVLGSEYERALRSAASRAVRSTARKLRPADDERAEQLALVTAHLLGKPLPADGLDEHPSLLDALRSGIGGQLAVLDDADLTGQDVSSAELLGVSGTELAETLTDCLVREIKTRALRDDTLAPLADQLNHDETHAAVRALARARPPAPLSEDRLRAGVETLLRSLRRESRGERLPRYLPEGCDITRMHRAVRVRDQPRRHRDRGEDTADTGGEGSATAYRTLPGDRSVDGGRPVPWLEFVRTRSRVVVLADPGLGKSWLVRTEVDRLATAALARLAKGDSPDQLTIPVSARCDELAASGEDTLGAALGQVVGRRLRLSPELRQWLSAHIDAGRVVVLLDAFDELPDQGARHRVVDLLDALLSGSGDVGAGAGPRCVVTSRIAGYAGSPLPRPVTEVELLPFERDDIDGVIASWGLDRGAERTLRDRLREPAVAGMARVPMLLALMCAIVAEGRDLPTVRGELYERVVRWFLSIDRSRPQTTGRPVEDVDRIIRALGPVALHFASHAGGWADLMDAGELAKVLEDDAGGPAPGRDGGAIIRMLSLDAGLLTPAGTQVDGRAAPYLFFHRTVAEFLAARHLAQQPRDVWLAAVAEHLWFDPDWAEVIPLLAGQLRDPADAMHLLEHLLGLSDDPYYRGLFCAGHVVAELPERSLRAARAQIDQLVERLISLVSPDYYTEPSGLAGPSADAALAAMIPRLAADAIEPMLRPYVLCRAPRVIRALSAAAQRERVREVLLHYATRDWEKGNALTAQRAALEALAPYLEREDVRRRLLRRFSSFEARVGGGPVTDTLATSTQHDDVLPAFASALRARWNRDGGGVLEHLLRHLDRASIRREVIEYLRRLCSRSILTPHDLPAALAEHLDDAELRSIVLDLLGHRDGDIRIHVAQVLASAIDTVDVRDALLARLRVERSLPVREHLVAALGRARFGHRVRLVGVDRPALVEGSTFSATRDVFALNDEWAKPEPELWLVDPDDCGDDLPPLLDVLTVRPVDAFHTITAWRLTRRLDHPEARSAFSSRLDHDDALVREFAARALASSAGRDDVRAALLSLLESEDDRFVRRALTRSLASAVDVTEVRRTCLKLLDDPDPSVRVAAEEALGRVVEHDEVREALLARLEVLCHHEATFDEFNHRDAEMVYLRWALTGPEYLVEDERTNAVKRYPNVRHALLRLLPEISDAEVCREVIRLLRCVVREDERVRHALVDLLVRESEWLRQYHAVSVLTDAVDDVRVRTALVGWLSKEWPKGGSSMVVEALASGDFPDTREMLLTMLDSRGWRADIESDVYFWNGGGAAAYAGRQASPAASARLLHYFVEELRSRSTTARRRAYPVLETLANRGYRHLSSADRGAVHRELAALTREVASPQRLRGRPGILED